METDHPSRRCSNAEDDAVLTILRLIIEQQLADVKTTDPKSSATITVDTSHMKQLENVSTPAVTMELITPPLFSIPTPTTTTTDIDTTNVILTNQEAIVALKALVSTDPKTYLKIASRAVLASAKSKFHPKANTKISSANTTFSSKDGSEMSNDFLQIIVSSLLSSDVEVSTHSSETISLLSSYFTPSRDFQERLIHLFESICVNAIVNNRAKLSNANLSTLVIRCASTLIDLMVLSDVAMEIILSKRLDDILLLNVLNDNSDPLMQISILDLLETKMACNTAGSSTTVHRLQCRWLYDYSRLVNVLLFMAGGDESEENGGDAFTCGPALRVLSCLMQLSSYPKVQSFIVTEEQTDDYRLLCHGFHRSLHNFDYNSGGELSRLAFLDAVSSYAGSSPHAMNAVLDDAYLTEGWLSLVISASNPKMKAAVLNSIASVIDNASSSALTEGENRSKTISSPLVMRLFDRVSSINPTRGQPSTTGILLSLARSPIVETRLASYNLMRSISQKCNAGAQTLLSYGGFFEFLINREYETIKEGKEGKFEIIKSIVNSDMLPLLEDSIVSKLQRFIQEGPYFVQATPFETMTEA